MQKTGNKPLARGLSAKQRMFVAEYLVDLNATAAAGRAGYKDANIGRQLITKYNVSAAIEKAVSMRSEKLSLSAEDVIQSILSIRAKAIQEGKLSEALKANGLLGRHLKMFTDRLEVSAGVDITSIMGACARVRLISKAGVV